MVYWPPGQIGYQYDFAWIVLDSKTYLPIQGATLNVVDADNVLHTATTNAEGKALVSLVAGQWPGRSYTVSASDYETQSFSTLPQPFTGTTIHLISTKPEEVPPADEVPPPWNQPPWPWTPIPPDETTPTPEPTPEPSEFEKYVRENWQMLLFGGIFSGMVGLSMYQSYDWRND